MNLNQPQQYAQLKRQVHQDFSASIVLQHYKKGDYIYFPSDTPERIYVIEEGIVKLGTYNDDGAPVVHDIIGPNYFFGNLRYLNNEYFNEFAKAATVLVVSAYHLPTIKAAFAENRTLNEWLTFMIIKRWALTEARLARISSTRPVKRVQKIIIELEQLIPNSTTLNYKWFEVISQKDIADLTGMTRQTVAKIFRELPLQEIPYYQESAMD
ncbi:MAG: Crp/Fnr family transcriptional regulator [Saprospiraceae bacterium]|nr:Crp/Fnr family transcriptional regulator [Saprospiraceae bacterium]